MSELPDAVPARNVGPGGYIRFAVGSSAGLRSATWRVWSAKHTADVYMAMRTLAGTKKISFHKTGSWSDSFVASEKVLSQLPAGMSRHIDIWQKPEPFGGGWYRGYEVIVPWTELRSWAAAEHGDIEFAPPPPPGFWVCIEIILADAGTPSRLAIEEPSYAIGRMTLAGASEVQIVARIVRPSPQAAQHLAVLRERLLMQGAQMVASAPQPQNLRLALIGQLDDGTRCTYDLAVLPPPPGHAVICTGFCGPFGALGDESDTESGAH
jgi:hypothetical protein